MSRTQNDGVDSRTALEREADELSAKIVTFEHRLANASFRVPCAVQSPRDSNFRLRFSRDTSGWGLWIDKIVTVVEIPKLRSLATDPSAELLNEYEETRSKPILQSSLSDRAAAVLLFESLLEGMRDEHAKLAESVASANSVSQSALDMLDALEGDQ